MSLPPALASLLSVDFPPGNRDGLGATEQHRLLAQRLQQTSQGKFWGAPKPACDFTFTRGTTGWLAMAVPFVVHDHPALQALGEAFTDGANLWIHGPWLQRQAAHGANDAQALVDWAGFALEDVAHASQGLAPEDALIGVVDPRLVDQALARISAADQPVWNRWHAPGDSRGVTQALTWAQRLDSTFATSGLPTPRKSTGLPDMPAATPWKAWASLFEQHAPVDDGQPPLRAAHASKEETTRIQELLQRLWMTRNTTHPLVHQVADSLNNEGLLDSTVLKPLWEAMQATTMGTVMHAPDGFLQPPSVGRLPLDYRDVQRLQVAHVDLNTLTSSLPVHPATGRPLPLTTPGEAWRQACVLSALNAGLPLGGPQAQGSITQVPWVLDLPEWRHIQRAGVSDEQKKLTTENTARLMETLSTLPAPHTFTRPTWQAQGLALEPRDIDKALRQILEPGPYFSSLLSAPRYARQVPQHPDGMIRGLMDALAAPRNAVSPVEAFALVRQQQDQRRWSSTADREALCRGFVDHQATQQWSGRGATNTTLDRTQHLFASQKSAASEHFAYFSASFAALAQALGLTSEHLLPALLSKASSFSEDFFNETVHAAGVDFIAQGFDLHAPRAILQSSAWACLETLKTTKPTVEPLWNALRHHQLNASLPSALPTPSRLRF